jgi:hypothetical protein
MHPKPLVSPLDTRFSAGPQRVLVLSGQFGSVTDWTKPHAEYRHPIAPGFSGAGLWDREQALEKPAPPPPHTQRSPDIC